MIEQLKTINDVVEKLSTLLRQKGLNDRYQSYLIGIVCLILKTDPNWNGKDNQIKQTMEHFGFDQNLKNQLLKVDQNGITSVINLIKNIKCKLMCNSFNNNHNYNKIFHFW